MLKLEQKISDCELVILDLETSGKYPIESDICEIAAVKYKGGQIIDTFQTLVKPKKPMSDFVIGIHHITNEMVSDAPAIEDIIGDFWNFCHQGVCVAHHAPFDLGFLAVDFERQNLELPLQVNLCTSLLARSLISGTENHRLQTLVTHFNISPGSAHRALDDAKSCLAVLKKCIEKISDSEPKLGDFIKIQQTSLNWLDFSMQELRKVVAYDTLYTAIESKTLVEIIYSGGSRPGKGRAVDAIAVVRNPQGDYLVAKELNSSNKPKRYYLKKISEAKLLPHSP